MRVVLTLTLALAVALPAVDSARAAPGAPPPGCHRVPATGAKTTHDYEAVFGRRRALSAARSLLRQVRAKGFRCAVIENEQRTHEVAVIALSERAALKVIRRAHRLRLKAYLAVS